MSLKYAFIFLIFISVTISAQPSFKCESDLSPQEALICEPQNIELQHLDRNLSDLYQANLTVDEKSVRKKQRKWINDRNECVDVSCLTESYYSQVKLLSDNLWKMRDELASCSQDKKAIAYLGMFNKLQKDNVQNLGNYYLSDIEFKDASKPGDGSVDLDSDGVIDQIVTIYLLKRGRNGASHIRARVDNLVTNFNGCLINIKNIGSLATAYSGSHGTESMDSFPMSSLADNIDYFHASSNKIAIKEIKNILSNSNFDTANFDLLRTFSYKGCAGGSLTDSFFAYDKKNKDLRKIYSRELECGKIYSQTFYYPIE